MTPKALIESFLREGRSVRFNACGSSMAPLLKDGDAMEVSPVAPEAVRLGDILLYRSDERLVAHRVVWRNGGFLLKADLGDGLDQVRAEQLLGRVERRSRAGRSLELGGVFWRWLGLAWCAVPCRFKDLERLWSVPGAQRLGRLLLREDIVIRRASLDDAEALSRAIPAGPYPELLEGLREELSGGVRFLAVTSGGRVVGSATLSRLEGGRWGLYGMWVHPRYRQRGLGERLCAEALRHADGPVELTVNRRAWPAIRLYRRLGFKTMTGTDEELGMSWHRSGIRGFLAAAGAEGLPRCDWDEVLEEAGQQGIPGLLGQRLSRLPEGLVPTEVLKTLKGAVYHNAAHGARLAHWAEAAAEALRKAGFKTAALKGLAMVESCYRGDSSLRALTDADLLAEEAAQGRARDILVPLGFVPQVGRQEFYQCPDGTLLEIHYQGDYAFWDMRGLLERSRPCGKPYHLPAPEDMLIFAGLHTVFHKLELKLVWLFDAAVLAREGMGWDRLLSLMEGHPGRPALRRFLLSAREECGAAVPDRVLESLREEGWRARAVDWLLERPPHSWLEPFAAHFLGRHPSVPASNLVEILWPTGPRLACRVGFGESGTLWRLKRPVYLAWRVLGALLFLLRGRAR